MDNIRASGNQVWQHIAGWLGKGSGSAWIMAGTLAFAGGSAAVLNAPPVKSTVVHVQPATTQPLYQVVPTFGSRDHDSYYEHDDEDDGGY